MKDLVTLRNFHANPFRLFDVLENDLNSTWENTKQLANIETHEDEQTYFFNFDLPGVLKEDVSLEINDGILRISAQRKDVFETGKTYSKIERSFSLPKDANSEAVAAHLENGVLSLSIQKEQKLAPKKIEITTKRALDS